MKEMIKKSFLICGISNSMNGNEDILFKRYVYSEVIEENYLENQEESDYFNSQEEI